MHLREHFAKFIYSVNLTISLHGNNLYLISRETSNNNNSENCLYRYHVPPFFQFMGLIGMASEYERNNSNQKPVRNKCIYFLAWVRVNPVAVAGRLSLTAPENGPQGTQHAY